MNKEDLIRLLEEVQTKIAEQGRIVDARLLDKQKMLERCLVDLDKTIEQNN